MWPAGVHATQSRHHRTRSLQNYCTIFSRLSSPKSRYNENLESEIAYNEGCLYTRLHFLLHFLSSLYRPDDDPDKGQNIVAKAKYILGKEMC
jgi:hypothetical protein